MKIVNNFFPQECPDIGFYLAWHPMGCARRMLGLRPNMQAILNNLCRAPVRSGCPPAWAIPSPESRGAVLS